MTDYRKIISSHVIPLLIAAMWAGMLWSRALLSIAMILFLLSSLLAAPLADHVRYVRTHLFLRLMPLLFLVPMLTGAWSQDKAEWMNILQLKLPLLLLPLLSLPLARFSGKATRMLLYWMGGTLWFSMGRTVWYFLWHMQETTTGYLQAKVLPVDLGNDHVRYGWLLALVFAGGLCLAVSERYRKDSGRKWLVALLVFIFIFQHLLASKTGLAGMYLTLFLFFFMKRQHAWVRRGAWMVLVLPLAAWALLPTFRNRLRFVLWDFQHYSRGAYTEGLSDAPRILSFKAGWDIWKDHPWLGCGFGDIRTETVKWYTRNTPALKAYEQILPSNEFILYGAAGGMAACFLFSLAVLCPFLIRGLRRSFFWLSFNLLAVAGFAYEIALETQFGIFIYAFLGCWLHAWLTRPAGTPIDQDLPN